MSEKSNSFVSSLKTVSVLLIICLVCGALLALCNNIFYVSPEEVQARVFKKYYPTFALDGNFNGTIDGNFAKLPNGNGEVLSVTKSTDGCYAIESKGYQGYKGWVSCYVFVKEHDDGKVYIEAWSNIDYSGETLMGNFSDKNRTEWYVGKEISSDWGINFKTEGFYLTGTTMSSQAIANCVAAASYYAMNALGLGANPEGDALKAINTLHGADIGFVKVNDDAYTTLVGVDYYFEGTDGTDTYGAYTYAVDDVINVAIVKAGQSNADLLASVPVTTDGFDGDKLTTIKSNGYLEYTLKQIYADFVYGGSELLDDANKSNATYGEVLAVYTSTDGACIIQSKGIGGFESGTVTINVAIKDGVIVGWNIVSHEKQSYMSTVLADKNLSNWYVGTSTSGVISMGSNATTGATFTSTAINNAVNMAASYYENVLKGGNI